MTELRIEYMDLGKIPSAARNPKRHDVDGIAASISRFGFNDMPAVNEGTGRLVEGHGRVKALREMRKRGEPVPDGVRLDGDTWMVPLLRGLEFPTDREAEAYLVAHNELTMASGWDETGLAAIVSDLQKDDASLLEAIGMSDARIRSLVDDYEPKLPTPPEEFKEPSRDLPDSVEKHTCPSCGHQWAK